MKHLSCGISPCRWNASEHPKTQGQAFGKHYLYSMEKSRKETRYQRIFDQLLPLLRKPAPLFSRMATLVALLHHKMPDFFWTGFYLLEEEGLFVGPYQGPLACQQLEKGKGVCWAGILRKETILVPDVHQFPGHIACDSRSNSEIVVPLYSVNEEIIGVLDIDSTKFATFDETDAFWLEKILALLNPPVDRN